MDLAGAGLSDFIDLLETIKSEFGSLHALIHCALDFDGLQPLEQVEPQKWLQSMQVNVNTPWLLTSTLLPLLKQSEYGRLFFILDDLERGATVYTQDNMAFVTASNIREVYGEGFYGL